MNVTSSPACTIWAPAYPPTAPAPTMAILRPILFLPARFFLFSGRSHHRLFLKASARRPRGRRAARYSAPSVELAPGEMLAAVDRDHGAGDASGLREIEHRRRDVLRLRAALERHRRGLARKLLSRLARARQRRAGRHRIDAQFRRQRLRQRDGRAGERALAQGVGEKRGVGLSKRWSTTLTIEASEPSSACAAKACARNTGAVRLTAIVRSKRARSSVAISSSSNRLALLTKSVSGANAAARISPRTAFGSARS